MSEPNKRSEQVDATDPQLWTDDGWQWDRAAEKASEDDESDGTELAEMATA